MTFNNFILRSIILLGFVMTAVLPSAGQVAKAAPTLSDDEIRAILQEQLTPNTDTGIVVAIVSPEGVRIIAVGKAGPNSAPPLNGDTVFEIGSATKVFTAATLSDMVERGEVSLEDPIKKFLPGLVRVPERNGKAITLIDLVTHTSGFPPLPSNLELKDSIDPDARSRYTVQQLYDFLSTYQLTRDIGSKYEYSNLGVGLIGHGLALKSKLSYEEMVTKRILKPLNMKDTAISLSPALRSRLAIGHDSWGNVVPSWNFPTLPGGGSLRSTAKDLVKFVQANLADAGTLSAALQCSHIRQRNMGIPGMDIGFCWMITKTPGGEIVWHNGQTFGYHSYIGLDLKNKTGVAILHNSSDSIDNVGFYLLNKQLPRPFKKRVEVKINAELLDAYIGEYELVKGITLTVTRQANELFVQATGEPKNQVFPASETEFFWKAIDVQITFVKDSTGKVSELVFHTNGQNIKAAKIK